MSNLPNPLSFGAKNVKFSFWSLSKGIKSALAIAMERFFRFGCSWMISTISLSENSSVYIVINVQYFLDKFRINNTFLISLIASKYLYHPFCSDHMNICSVSPIQNGYNILAPKNSTSNRICRYHMTIFEFLRRRLRKLDMNEQNYS